MLSPQRIARPVWLRGFFPSIAVLLLVVLSTGSWVMWQGPGAVPLRFAFGGGFVMLAWHDPSNPAAMRRWIGPRTWYISVLYTDSAMTQTYRGWLVMHPLWSARRFRLENALRIHEQEIVIPLLPTAVVLALWPTARVVWRRFNPRRKPWECRRCGYDLRGFANGTCPECGTVSPVA